MTINSDSTPNPDPVAAALSDQLETLRRASAGFRDLVRNRAIRGYDELDWSLESLNDKLRELGLQPHESRTVTQADLDNSVTIMADTDDGHIGTAATNDIDRLKSDIAACQAADAEFRDQVRQLMKQQWNDGEWCVPGIQRVLKEIGLPPIATKVQGSVLIRVRIDAVTGVADEEEAMALVTAALSVTCSDPGITWSLDLLQPYLDVEPADD